MPPGISGDPWRQDPEARALLRDLALRLVPEVSPEEADIADELFEDAVAPPARAVERPLAFGGQVALVSDTALIVSVLAIVLPALWKTVWEKAAADAGEALWKRIRAFFLGAEKKPLSNEDLRRVWEATLQTALQQGLSADKAKALANATVGILALH